MEIKIAEDSGYCFGVKRALKITGEILKKNKGDKKTKVFTLGSIIHNSGVSDELTKKGLISVIDLKKIEPGSIFIIRSHGMSPNLIREIKGKDVKIIDTTCPFVKKAQARAGELSSNGYFVIIIGNKTHPEVMGIKDYVLNENYTVIENEADLERLHEKDKIGIVVQTTQILDRLVQISGKSLKKTKELIVYNTICDTTRNRQNFTEELAKEVDVMIIVGGKNSANTRNLTSISKKINKKTYHIESCREIRPEWFKKVKKVGISGGASTPVEDIIDVKKAIEKL
jgi:4-hydroxy-3-methylbut-2-enyl diphosphate reductase